MDDDRRRRCREVALEWLAWTPAPPWAWASVSVQEASLAPLWFDPEAVEVEDAVGSRDEDLGIADRSGDEAGKLIVADESERARERERARGHH